MIVIDTGAIPNQAPEDESEPHFRSHTNFVSIIRIEKGIEMILQIESPGQGRQHRGEFRRVPASGELVNHTDKLNDFLTISPIDGRHDGGGDIGLQNQTECSESGLQPFIGALQTSQTLNENAEGHQLIHFFLLQIFFKGVFKVDL